MPTLLTQIEVAYASGATIQAGVQVVTSPGAAVVHVNPVTQTAAALAASLSVPTVYVCAVNERLHNAAPPGFPIGSDPFGT